MEEDLRQECAGDIFCICKEYLIGLSYAPMPKKNAQESSSIDMSSLLSSPEAAKRLGITTQRLQQLIWAGMLPAVKIGRNYVIKVEDLKLVESRKTPGRPRKPSTSN